MKAEVCESVNFDVLMAIALLELVTSKWLQLVIGGDC